MQLSGDDERPRIAKVSGRGRERPYVEKPSGYSFFPKELVPMPKSWVAQSCNLVSASIHESGGHFAVSRERQVVTPAAILNGFTGDGEAEGATCRHRGVPPEGMERSE